MRTLRTRTPEATRQAARRLGRRLRPLDLLCLIGSLGAGKTTFVQGLVQGLHFRGQATSPSFALAKVYQTPRLTLYHLDLFRLESDELGQIGLEDYLGDPQAACAIEWPEAAESQLPKDRLEILFKVTSHGRSLALKPLGPRAQALSFALLKP